MLISPQCKISLKKFQCNTSLLRNNVKKLQLPITTLIFFKEYFEYTFINFFRIYILMDNEKLNVEVNLVDLLLDVFRSVAKNRNRRRKKAVCIA